MVLAQAFEGAELPCGRLAEEIEINPVGELGLIAVELLSRLVELVQCGRHALCLPTPRRPISACLMVRPARRRV